VHRRGVGRWKIKKKTHHVPGIGACRHELSSQSFAQRLLDTESTEVCSTTPLQNQKSMAKRNKARKPVARKKAPTKNPPPSPKRSRKAAAVPSSERTDPGHRGIHSDAISTGRAPTSAASCVACDTSIPKGSARWGLKYAGNPLPIPVLPLYGSHPMVQWCHGSSSSSCCGLAFRRFADMNDDPPAARTCHACQDGPDDANDATSTNQGIRLLCGGVPKGKKIRHHVFHIGCWLRAIAKDSYLENELTVDPRDIGKTTTKLRTLGGLSWDDLTPSEREFVLREFGEPTGDQ